MTANRTRELLWISIVHTQTDLGSMSQAIQQIYARKMGKGQWERRVQTVEKMWRHLRASIDRLGLDYSTVRLYQDGLPNCGREVDIVRDLAKAGSLNHRLILNLMEHGATLTGTESPELLLEEYDLARQVLTTLDSPKQKSSSHGLEELGHNLLERRDRYIAERIGQTLEAGETGLIFLGVLHSLEGLLPTDLHVTRLQPGPTIVALRKTTAQ